MDINNITGAKKILTGHKGMGTSYNLKTIT